MQNNDNNSVQQSFWSGLTVFERRLAKQRALYAEILAHASRQDTPGSVLQIDDTVLFRACLQTFGPALPSADQNLELERLYDVAFDKPSGALIIANRGATLWCLAPRSQQPYLARHIGLALYIPGLGLETVNVALVGNVYDGRIVLRSESACTPSFLFGSQRCNCAHQWESCRELAAYFNPAGAPQLDGRDFERWVQQQLVTLGGRHKFRNAGPGFVLLHIDTQNGMGSGYTENEFSADLFSRASLRHRGEYSAEQILGTSMAGGFRAIGIEPDPRAQGQAAGYQVASIVLDYLDVARDLILLSNNRAKIRALEARGYNVTRVKSLGAVNSAGALEAEERGRDFAHLDIDAANVSFGAELERVKTELSELLGFDALSAKAA